jgi:multicomponent Na+:H+ antiporter subunit C
MTVYVERMLLFLLFLVGFWGILAKKNIIKKIFSLNLITSAVVVLFILEGSRVGDHAPILSDGIERVVDPVPQALMLTAIVISVCITAFALALAFHLYKTTGSFDIDDIRKRAQDES